MLESLPTNNMSGNLTLGCFQLARLLFLLGHAFFLPVREGHPIFDCPFCHVPAHPGEKIGCCLTFGSHTDAFALHECARAHGYSTRISTTPRAIQASCGGRAARRMRGRRPPGGAGPEGAHRHGRYRAAPLPDRPQTGQVLLGCAYEQTTGERPTHDLFR